MKKKYLLSIIAILSIISVTPFFIDLIVEKTFHFQLSQKSETAAAQQFKRKQALDQTLGSALSGLDFSCSKHDKHLLQSSAKNNRYIMLLGIVTSQGEICSSLGEHVNISIQDSFSKITLNNNLYIFNVNQMIEGGGNLIFSYNSNKGILFSVLGTDSFYSLLDKECVNCFYIEFLVDNNTVFTLGDKNITNEHSHKNRTSSMKPNKSISVITYAGNTLLAHVKTFVYKMIVIGLVLLVVLFFVIIKIINARRDTLHNKLILALKSHELIPFYQPIYNVTSKQFVGAEVLIRWKHDQEWISPEQFIPFAEEHDLIIPITDYLLDKTSHDMKKVPHDFWYSVNVSAKHFEDDKIIKSISKLDSNHHKRIYFELTERHPIKNIDNARVQIDTLAQKGFQFKLDDFGTGYGGIAYLQQLGIRAIKIDKMFVDTIGTDDFKLGVLESIIAFGIASNYELIAEGVETQEQADYLNNKGVVLHQGYFYAKPMSIHDFYLYVIQPKYKLKYHANRY